MHFLRIGHNQNLPNVDTVARHLIEFLQFSDTEVKFFGNAVQRVFRLNRVTSSQCTRETECQDNCNKSNFHAVQFTRCKWLDSENHSLEYECLYRFWIRLNHEISHFPAHGAAGRLCSSASTRGFC